MRIHYLQHVPFEGLGSIKSWVHDHGFELTSTRLFDDEALPDLGDINWLIIMGGPMSTYDEEQHPWLATEKRFIHQAIAAGKIVLGICLGAQLIAEVLGGSVMHNREKEVGWFPVKFRANAEYAKVFHQLPEELVAFHWHSDTFSIPKGAVAVASSEVTPNQAFVYQERVVGLQFHLEMTKEIIKNLCSRFASKLIPGQYIQTEAEMLKNPEYFVQAKAYMAKLLDHLLEIS